MIGGVCGGVIGGWGGIVFWIGFAGFRARSCKRVSMHAMEECSNAHGRRLNSGRPSCPVHLTQVQIWRCSGTVHNLRIETTTLTIETPRKNSFLYRHSVQCAPYSTVPALFCTARHGMETVVTAPLPSPQQLLALSLPPLASSPPANVDTFYSPLRVRIRRRLQFTKCLPVRVRRALQVHVRCARGAISR